MRLSCLLVLSMIVSACSDSSPPDRLLPGPCRATSSIYLDNSSPTTVTATYSYDEDDRLVRVERPTVHDGSEYDPGFTTEYTRDAEGAITAIHGHSEDAVDPVSESWT